MVPINVSGHDLQENHFENIKYQGGRNQYVYCTNTSSKFKLILVVVNVMQDQGQLSKFIQSQLPRTYYFGRKDSIDFFSNQAIHYRGIKNSSNWFSGAMMVAISKVFFVDLVFNSFNLEIQQGMHAMMGKNYAQQRTVGSTPF